MKSRTLVQAQEASNEQLSKSLALVGQNDQRMEALRNELEGERLKYQEL